ncbi:MAG: NUDIX domain-containing protein, partial [Chitinophagaceae bacterium]
MHIKVYFNDKPLYLCDSLTPEINEYLHHDDTIFIDELSVHTVKAMLHEMQEPRVHAGIFVHEDFDALKNAFWKKFKIISAAGGLVLNENDEVLLIYRRGAWDLPKGKQDDPESIEECA